MKVIILFFLVLNLSCKNTNDISNIEETFCDISNGNSLNELNSMWVRDDKLEEMIIIDDCTFERRFIWNDSLCYGNLPTSDCINFIMNSCDSLIPIQKINSIENVLVFSFPDSVRTYNLIQL